MNKTGIRTYITIAILALAVLLIPLCVSSQYIIHIAILIFIWGLAALAWSYMGRFGLVSLGNGAFMGIGAYAVILLYNKIHLTPWAGILIGCAGAVLLSAVLGYCCFRSGVVGDYFGLVTLALAEVVALAVVVFRKVTLGELGLNLETYGGTSLWYLQSEGKVFFYYVCLFFLVFGLLVWRLIDKSKMRRALQTIGEDETVAASLGIDVVKYKMIVTMISAGVTALAGVLYAQYMTYINPHTVAGVGVSLSIPFKAIIGGMFTAWGPVLGSAIIVSLEEFFRIAVGAKFVTISQIIFGVTLIVLIMYLPKGIYGTLKDYSVMGLLTRKGEKDRKALKGKGLVSHCASGIDS